MGLEVDFKGRPSNPAVKQLTKQPQRDQLIYKGTKPGGRPKQQTEINRTHHSVHKEQNQSNKLTKEEIPNKQVTYGCQKTQGQKKKKKACSRGIERWSDVA